MVIRSKVSYWKLLWRQNSWAFAILNSNMFSFVKFVSNSVYPVEIYKICLFLKKSDFFNNFLPNLKNLILQKLEILLNSWFVFQIRSNEQKFSELTDIPL